MNVKQAIETKFLGEISLHASDQWPDAGAAAAIERAFHRTFADCPRDERRGCGGNARAVSEPSYPVPCSCGDAHAQGDCLDWPWRGRLELGREAEPKSASWTGPEGDAWILSGGTLD